VYIKSTGTIKGRGAFAGRAHQAGEVVETCPVVAFGGKLSGIPQDVQRILFDWGTLTDTGRAYCLALGYGAMYNHDNPSNLRFEADEQAQTIRFIAVRDIAADEELTINYNAHCGAHTSDEDTWFDARGVTILAPDAP
jgi:SET domain